MQRRTDQPADTASETSETSLRTRESGPNIPTEALFIEKNRGHSDSREEMWLDCMNGAVRGCVGGCVCVVTATGEVD